VAAPDRTTHVLFGWVRAWQLLDPSARIVLDINKNRTGLHYDPFGIVSRVLKQPKWGQVRGSTPSNFSPVKPQAKHPHPTFIGLLPIPPEPSAVD
jgi:hypothetical protein